MSNTRRTFLAGSTAGLAAPLAGRSLAGRLLAGRSLAGRSLAGLSPAALPLPAARAQAPASGLPAGPIRLVVAYATGGGSYQAPTMIRDGAIEREHGYLTDIITRNALGFLDAQAGALLQVASRRAPRTTRPLGAAGGHSNSERRPFGPRRSHARGRGAR